MGSVSSMEPSSAVADVVMGFYDGEQNHRPLLPLEGRTYLVVECFPCTGCRRLGRSLYPPDRWNMDLSRGPDMFPHRWSALSSVYSRRKGHRYIRHRRVLEGIVEVLMACPLLVWRSSRVAQCCSIPQPPWFVRARCGSADGGPRSCVRKYR